MRYYVRHTRPEKEFDRPARRHTEPHGAALAETEQEQRNTERTERELGVHIFSVSATLVGVCLTVVGLFRVVVELRKVETAGDDLLALDSLLFLTSCSLAYIALRARTCERRARIERFADGFFLSGLGVMAVACVLIARALV